MKVFIEAHRDEVIHDAGSRAHQEIAWPEGLPIPSVGDEFFWHGATVVVRLRHFGWEDDSHVTLYWMDVRSVGIRDL